jgi:hypothetical protein
MSYLTNYCPTCECNSPYEESEPFIDPLNALYCISYTCLTCGDSITMQITNDDTPEHHLDDIL